MTISSHAGSGGDGIVNVRVPLEFRKRGGRKVVISPEGQPVWTPSRLHVDSTLVRAVVQAFHWKERLDAGEFATVSELAAAEKLNGSYVAHMLRLTLLRPDIVEAILDGRQPRTMQLQPLMREFSDCWNAQRATFA